MSRYYDRIAKCFSEEESSHFFLILLAEKEVNELMEELFETVSVELGVVLKNRSFSDLT